MIAITLKFPKFLDIFCEFGKFLKGLSRSGRINMSHIKLIEHYPTQNGVVQVFKLKTAFEMLIRPLRKLHPLELCVGR